MLRLFSSIRKTLINEGKTSRYVRYAVGEVLLIMVGILLALQINNWNEVRKLEQERRELIQNLESDFRATREELFQSLDRAASKKDSLQLFLTVASGENESLSIKEIKSLVNASFIPLSFNPTLGTYNAAMLNGDLKLINDPHLYELLASFESRLEVWKDLHRLGREDAFYGTRFEIRNKIGSEYFLTDGADRYRPKTYALSDIEYLDFIKKKEIYGLFATAEVMSRNQHGVLENVKEQVEQILTELEALD